MQAINKYIYFTLFTMLISCTVQAQDKRLMIDSLITKAYRMGLFNGNVLVIDNNNEVYRKAIGYADASKKTKLTKGHRFHIGSIAKEFNAVAVMMLKDQGKLSLDDKVSTYLTDLPGWAKTISVKNLLQYTSGLPDLKWKSIDNDKAAMDSLRKVTSLDFEPGTKYAYNNSNTLLQRKVVEKLSGLTFTAFVEQRILAPLKMNSSVVDPDERAPLMTMSFNNDNVNTPTKIPFGGWTAVTLDDFNRWEIALKNFSIISPAATLAILTPFAPRKQCGLGGGTMDGNKLLTHVHDGTAGNYQALLTANTTQGRRVILLTNNKQNNLYDINNAIQNILDGKPFQQPKKSVMTALQAVIDSADGKRILQAYQQLKEHKADEFDLLSESTLNTIGYALISKKKYADAIVIFEHNAELFPRSSNVYDSLAEAYYNKGDKPKALANYKRAYELDPANTAAKQKITELQQ